MSLIGSESEVEVEVESAPRPDRLALEALIISRKPSSVRVATCNKKRISKWREGKERMSNRPRQPTQADGMNQHSQMRRVLVYLSVISSLMYQTSYLSAIYRTTVYRNEVKLLL